MSVLVVILTHAHYYQGQRLIIDGLAKGVKEIVDQRNLYLEDVLAVQRDGITEEMRASWIAVVEATADVEATEA